MIMTNRASDWWRIPDQFRRLLKSGMEEEEVTLLKLDGDWKKISRPESAIPFWKTPAEDAKGFLYKLLEREMGEKYTAPIISTAHWVGNVHSVFGELGGARILQVHEFYHFPKLIDMRCEDAYYYIITVWDLEYVYFRFWNGHLDTFEDFYHAEKSINQLSIENQLFAHIEVETEGE